MVTKTKEFLTDADGSEVIIYTVKIKTQDEDLANKIMGAINKVEKEAEK